MCHSCSIFSRCVPLFCTTIEPFHASLKFPGPPPRSRPLFPSVCLLPPSLFCSPAAHKNSSFLSPEDCSVAWGFTAFLYVFSPFPSLSVSLSLCFGSATLPLIHSTFSFVCLTHLYPFKTSLCFSFPFCQNNILIRYLSFQLPPPLFFPPSTHSTCPTWPLLLLGFCHELERPAFTHLAAGYRDGLQLTSVFLFFSFLLGWWRWRGAPRAPGPGMRLIYELINRSPVRLRQAAEAYGRFHVTVCAC